MKKGQIVRSLMLIAGVLAFVATLLFEAPGTQQQTEKARSEKKADDSKAVYVQAPVVAIPGTAIQMEDSALPVLSEISLPDAVRRFPRTIVVEVTRYFSVLFRTLIAPNAP